MVIKLTRCEKLWKIDVKSSLNSITGNVLFAIFIAIILQEKNFITDNQIKLACGIVYTKIFGLQEDFISSWFDLNL